jgi:hypothetical protein
VEGDTNSVPVVYVPTATPSKKTPSSGSVNFSLVGAKMTLCGGQRTVVVKVKNNGNKGLESAWMRVYDLSQDKTLYGPASSNTPFRSSYQDCSAGGDYLAPGKALYIGAELGTQNISSHNLDISIQMCTGEGLSGRCDMARTTYKVP